MIRQHYRTAESTLVPACPGYVADGAVGRRLARTVQRRFRLAALRSAAGLKEKAVSETEMFLGKVPDYKDRKKLEQFIRDNKRP
ncbi:MAG: hypothetical protein HXY20_02930 [Acidobacteria bacterium]|nr:hypothetical protein [Acidobacteriota bacterium]